MQRGGQGMCTKVWVPEEARGTRFPAAGVTGGSEPSDMGAEN